MNKRLTAGIAALALLPALLALTACSGSSADSKDDSKKAGGGSSKVETTAYDWQLSFAKCMRDEGQTTFADPKPDGSNQGISITGTFEAFTAAQKTCTTKTTSKLGEKPVSDAEKKEKADSYAAELKEAKCLRGKGFAVSDPVQSGQPKAREIGKDENGRAIPDAVYKACGITAAAPAS